MENVLGFYALCRLLNHNNSILDKPIVETVLRKHQGYSSPSVPKETNKNSFNKQALRIPSHPAAETKFPASEIY